MSRTQFHLTTEWWLNAPVTRVWEHLSQPERWPEWWPAVASVETLSSGDANGLGAHRRMRWSTALPYEMDFTITTTRVEKHRLIEGRSDGALAGVGTWQLSELGRRTLVRYDWRVDLKKPWMRVALPLMRPIFAWNHNKVMEWGRDGLCQRLKGSSLLDALQGALIGRYSRLH